MVSCCSESHLLAIDQALERMLNECCSVQETEYVDIANAVDRILAEDIVSEIDSPPANNSAMDGYAVRSSDKGLLRIIGRSFAGHTFDGQVTHGTCVKITTGATVPSGADAVIMQEHTQCLGDFLQLDRTVEKYDNIRFQGEDVVKGQRLLRRGRRLSPTDVAITASLGFVRVRVFRKLKVAVVSTGDEIVLPGTPLAEGQIYDSNRYGIIALLKRLDFDVEDLGLIRDHRETMREAFQIAAARCDAIICSGGVSVGEADFVKSVLNEIGKMEFWKVAIKPGKPFAFGRIGDSVFFGLPGNPVSALVTLHQLAIPVMRQMAGEKFTDKKPIKMASNSPYHKRRGRVDFQRGSLTFSADGTLAVQTTGSQGSGVLSSFIDADCYIVLEYERGHVQAGETVNVIPFDRFLQ